MYSPRPPSRVSGGVPQRIRGDGTPPPGKGWKPAIFGRGPFCGRSCGGDADDEEAFAAAAGDGTGWVERVDVEVVLVDGWSSEPEDTSAGRGEGGKVPVELVERDRRQESESGWRPGGGAKDIS